MGEEYTLFVYKHKSSPIDYISFTLYSNLRVHIFCNNQILLWNWTDVTIHKYSNTQISCPLWHGRNMDTQDGIHKFYTQFLPCLLACFPMAWVKFHQNNFINFFETKNNPRKYTNFTCKYSFPTKKSPLIDLFHCVRRNDRLLTVNVRRGLQNFEHLIDI